MSTHPIFEQILADIQRVPLAVANATRPELAEFAARVNADTIAAMQREHAEEVARMEQEIGRILRAKAALRDRLDRFDRAVIEVDGKRRTLSSILDDEQFFDLCRCGDPECDGCEPDRRELRYEASAEPEDWR